MKQSSRSRRTFLKSAAALTTALSAPSILRGFPSKQLNIGGIGVGGKGSGDIASTSRGQNVVAICDVDRRRLGEQRKRYTGAREYTDWRKLLEQPGIDAVTVSTPDHMHAPIAVSAMQLGKHVYVQKPLAHTVFEARQMRRLAAKYRVVSQMGNQGHSGSAYRTVVKLIREGAIGKVRETHTWSNRPIWPQGVESPKESAPIPEYLDWDSWLGVAAHRPYATLEGGRKGRSVYHPFNWRGWLDFGTGALGDMGCHIMDPVVWSLELGSPLRVWSDGPAPNAESFPKWGVIHYEFPGTKHTSGETIRMTWHDGGRKPSRELVPLPGEEKVPANGCLFLGEKGVLLCPHGGNPRLLPAGEFKDKIELVESDDHYQQWTKACLGEGEATSHFDYAGPLTETVLLGTIAIRFPERVLEWDAETLSFPNCPLADHYVHHPYRQSWEVAELSAGVSARRAARF